MVDIMDIYRIPTYHYKYTKNAFPFEIKISIKIIFYESALFKIIASWQTSYSSFVTHSLCANSVVLNTQLGFFTKVHLLLNLRHKSASQIPVFHYEIWVPNTGIRHVRLGSLFTTKSHSCLKIPAPLQEIASLD